MNVVYYLSIVLLVVGLPALLIVIVIALIKPHTTQKLFKHQWSRKRISALGATSIVVGVIALSLIADATMPANVRAEIAAQQKAEADAKAKQIADEQALKKAQQEKEALANKPVTKTETVKSSVAFTSSEKEDASLPKGQRKTTTTGVNGEKTETYEVTYINSKETARKLVKSEVTTQPVNEVISVGTYVEPISTPTYTAPAPSQSTEAYYANCSDARAAGVAPIYRGQSGYRSDLDRDHDGVACE